MRNVSFAGVGAAGAGVGAGAGADAGAGAGAGAWCLKSQALQSHQNLFAAGLGSVLPAEIPHYPFEVKQQHHRL